MDQVTQTKRYLRWEQWKSTIAACQSSGMTVKSWCKQNNICQQTYYRNLKKHREEIVETLPAPMGAYEKAVSFHKLEVEGSVCNSQARVFLHLPSATLEICDGSSYQTIEAVLLAWKSIC